MKRTDAWRITASICWLIVGCLAGVLDGKADSLVVVDTYDEIIESLSRLAESKLGLLIVERRKTSRTN